ncbi:MAG: hypothetical protein OEY03_11765, partial [Rhizobacter sp.]|nr:hypothetical protein [Rhizobacter sp.]
TFFSSGTGFSASGDNSTLTTSLSVNARYEASAKIRLNAGLRYSRRNLDNQLVVAGLPGQTVEGVDSLRSFSLGASYVPTRSVQLGCNTARDERRASGGLSSSYTVNTNLCSAQFTLQ